MSKPIEGKMGLSSMLGVDVRVTEKAARSRRD